jgi:hypothetical protein
MVNQITDIDREGVIQKLKNAKKNK